MFEQSKLGAILNDPISDVIIHSMGALFVDDTDLYMWREHIMDPTELWAQTQVEIAQWSNLLNAMGGAMKQRSVSGIYWTTHVQTKSGPTPT
jgi:hypothetical protein